ncbi:GTPase HflX [Clostridia bacterium]|nr:GTPase HflX [Clostridia bacterium]
MENFEKTPVRVRALSAAAILRETSETNEETIAAELRELSELASTAGAEIVAEVVQNREVPDGRTYLGIGKIAEIADICRKEDIELVIFDCELSPAQLRNIEKELNQPPESDKLEESTAESIQPIQPIQKAWQKVRVIDRTILILDIFAGRAVSGEGKLQVELAQLQYRLPRLSGLGSAMSRLGGGIGTRGPGETKLETDRRHIRRRIDTLKAELKELETRREFSRSRRRKDGVLSVAIVGYTNAGKSTLLNSLTQAGVLSEDKLFATLDLTSRKLLLPDGRTAVLTDTVGLIRKLPHHLVEAFKSTLEEAASATLILHLCDISDDEFEEKYGITEKILAELGATDVPVLQVLNKCDRISSAELAVMKGKFPEAVFISARTDAPSSLDVLVKAITDSLPESARRMKLKLPYDKSGFSAKIRENGKIFTEEFTPDGVIVDALVDVKLQKSAEAFMD